MGVLELMSEGGIDRLGEVVIVYMLLDHKEGIVFTIY